MSYTDMDIEMKALSMLGSNVPDEDAQMLRTVCTAAAAELEGRLRRGVSSDDMTELFTTAAGMLAISMYMELGSAHSGGVSGFTGMTNISGSQQPNDLVQIQTHIFLI